LLPGAGEGRAEALAQVDQALLKQWLIDRRSQVSDEFVTQLSFGRRSSLPTPGTLVKGCLDDCDTCEPSLDTAIELDLKRQIELLDKSHEHRCCPAGEAVPASP
jgi:hypothetical protein